MSKIEFELTPMNIELAKRFARNPDSFIEGLGWLSDGLTPVTTETAFQLARGGRTVFMIHADGLDTVLDDIEMESEHYPDKTLSYPDIETIFVVEGRL